MSNLKKISSSPKLLDLPVSKKKCQVEKRETCVVRNWLADLQNTCKCIPYKLSAFKSEVRIFILHFYLYLYQEDQICSPRGILCSNEVKFKYPACDVTCAGFYGDVQKEVPQLSSGKDFSRLEDLTKEYNQWKGTFSKNLFFNSSATDFSEP